MKDGTRVLRAGVPRPSQGAPFLPGPVLAGPYHAAGDPSLSPYTYGRFHNPTWALYEQALEDLEGGPCVVLGSGMAAAAAVFGALLRPGDVVVLPSDSYYTIRLLAAGYFTEMGVVVRTAPTAGGAQRELVGGARLIWVETPCNPRLDVCDIAEMAKAAHEAGALLAVDNTTPTVLGQCPLALGADLSVASDTKALTGHSDIILGHVAAKDQALADRIRLWRTQIGAIPGPMEVWLAHRSLATLDLRLERQSANAMAIATYLKGREDVEGIRYPGLEDDPSYPVASKQMTRYGTIVGFCLQDRARAEAFLAGCDLISEATSFGGVHTTAERRARWGGDDVPEGFIRLSVGCEDAEDIITDISMALDRSFGD